MILFLVLPGKKSLKKKKEGTYLLLKIMTGFKSLYVNKVLHKKFKWIKMSDKKTTVLEEYCFFEL